MKKIIKGKSYDTQTAKLVGSWSNQVPRSDFSRCDENLYQKRSGEFFLYGEGGPMSKYAKSCDGNNWGSGSNIIPISYDLAQKWAEEKLTAEEYESIFGEIIEDETDNKKIASLIYLSPAAKEKAKRIATKRNINLSALIESLIMDAE